jgi:hypothetical protein
MAVIDPSADVHDIVSELRARRQQPQTPGSGSGGRHERKRPEGHERGAPAGGSGDKRDGHRGDARRGGGDPAAERADEARRERRETRGARGEEGRQQRGARGAPRSRGPDRGGGH